MKQINVEILVVEEKENTGKTGKPYKFVEVTYKEYINGKPNTKGYKALEFNTPEEVYQALLNAQKGDTLAVTMEKNAGGYWQWVEVATQHGDIKGEPVAGSKAEEYKAQEDRRQTLIVRQSCLAQAVQVSVATGELNPDDVMDLAQRFEAHINR